MRKTLITGVLSLMLTVTAFAQNGNSFPALTGKTLDNKTLTIPIDTKGKYTLLGVAFSRKSEEALQSWLQPMFSAFIDEKSMWDTEAYDINVLFIPMTAGITGMSADAIEKRMKEFVDPALHSKILLYTGNIDPMRKPLGLDKRDTPYFFILDENGTIVYSTSGEYSERKMKEIEKKLEASLD
jgi:hypothetical protein